MLEINVATIVETKNFSRKKTCFILTLILIFVGLPAALSYSSLDLNVAGSKILDIMDNIFGTMGLPIMALFIAIIFTWFLDKKVLAPEISDSPHWQFIVFTATKYIIPAVLIIVLISNAIYFLK